MIRNRHNRHNFKCPMRKGGDCCTCGSWEDIDKALEMLNVAKSSRGGPSMGPSSLLSDPVDWPPTSSRKLSLEDLDKV